MAENCKKREEDEIKLNENEEQSETRKENKLNITELIEESEKSKVQQTEEGKLKRNEEVRVYKPPIPFPHKLQKSKLDDQFSKFSNS